MKLEAKNHHRECKAFTLIEMIGVIAIIAILAGVSMVPILGLIEQSRLRAERQKLAMIAGEIRASFRQEDFNLNISTLPGAIFEYPSVGAQGETIYPTKFDISTPVIPVAGADLYSMNAWYARLAKLRGQDTGSLNGQVSSNVGAVKEIAFNAYRARRILICGPREVGVSGPVPQRYILMSFMFADAGSVTIPSPPNMDPSSSTYAAWFDALYDHPWGQDENGPAAPGWSANWAKRGMRGATRAQCVVVERITQPRYNVTINNNAPPITVGATTNYDFIFPFSNVSGTGATMMANLSIPDGVPAQVNPARIGDSVQTFPSTGYGILEGRRVIIKRGQTGGTASLVLSFLINENTTYTAQ